MKQFHTITMGPRCNRSDASFIQLLAYQGRRLARKWLRRPGRLARHIAFRNWALLHWKQGLSRDPIENEHESHLCYLGDRWDRLATAAQSDEGRLSRHVVIPNVVVHHLEVPHQFACRGLQRD